LNSGKRRSKINAREQFLLPGGVFKRRAKHANKKNMAWNFIRIGMQLIGERQEWLGNRMVAREQGGRELLLWYVGYFPGGLIHLESRTSLLFAIGVPVIQSGPPSHGEEPW
jgi:hypothetical protein